MKEQMCLCPCRNTDVSEKLAEVKQLIQSPPSDALKHHDLTKEQYDLLLPSAIASLTGVARASAQRPREDFVKRILEELRSRGELEDVEDMTHVVGRRFDFRARTTGKRVVVIEVKGGEGNSVTLGDRPPGCDEFVVWCHLTGSLQKQPAEQTRAIIGRLVKVMVNESEQSKRYDVLVIWDTICGTGTRNCPGADKRVVPCFFLFPEMQPTMTQQHPAVHTLQTTDFPKMILQHLGIAREKWLLHTWQVEVELLRPEASWKRRLTYHHLGSGSSWAGTPQLCRPLQYPCSTR
jgi:hypothetical protein